MALASLLIALACGLLMVRFWRFGLAQTKVLALACLFILGQQLLGPQSLVQQLSTVLGQPSWLPEDIRFLFANSALYVSLPMMTLVHAVHLTNKRFGWRVWSAATWGRVFLGLVAMFELGRRGDFNSQYSYLLYGLWLLVIVCTVFDRPAIKPLANKPTGHWLVYLSLVCMLGFAFSLIQQTLHPATLLLLPVSLVCMGYYYCWQFTLSEVSI